MEKYIKWSDESELTSTTFEYEIGEVIWVNSVDRYKCVDKKVIEGKLVQFFKKGILTFDY